MIKMAIVLELVLLSLFLPHQESSSEDVPAQLNIQMQIVTLNDGKAQLQTVTWSRVNVMKLERLLREDEIRKEIEVVDNQVKKLDRLLDQVSRDANRFSAAWKRKPPSSHQKRNLEKIRETRHSELESILLPIQFERIKEIKHRLQLRSHGVIPFLKTNRETLGLQFSQKQQTQFAKTLKRLTDETKSDLDNAFKDSMQSLLDILDKSQKEQLKQVQVDCGFVDDFDIYLAQLRYLNEHSFEFGITSDARFESMLEFAPRFDVSFDGRFRARKSGDDPIVIPNIVDQLIEIPDNILELTPDQRESLAKEKNEYWERVRALQRIRERQMQATGVVTEQENDHFNEEIGLASARLNSGYESILNPIQSVAVRSLHAQSVRPQFGLIANLVRGDLGRELKLSTAQRNKIEEQSQLEVQRLEGMLLDWDEKIMTEIQDNLDDECRKRLRDLIGERMTHVVPTYRMLISSNSMDQ